jgi:RNA-directed DNA polymerase
MSRIARHVQDKAVLKLSRAYLVAGISDNEQAKMRTMGTPQGGLLSNIILTDLDNELEHRGHKFCRSAEDCNIYVKSEHAGQRVLQNPKRSSISSV